MASTLDVVRRADDRVGDRPGEEALEWRLDHAEKVSNRPWQFCFVLGGGWRRAEQAAGNARAVKADIMLAGAAIRQIASRDARSKRDDIMEMVTAVGLTRQESEEALDWLLKERLLVSADDLRCPHQRFAGVVLARILDGQDARGREAIAELLHLALTSRAFPLAGLRSLLHELRFNGKLGRWSGLIEPSRLNVLVERIWASDANERVFAMLILSELSDCFSDWPRSLLNGHVEQLGDWISDPVDPTGYGIRHLVNAVYQKDEALGKAIVAAADPVRVAAAISRATPETAYNLAELMNGIGPARSSEWKSAFSEELDRNACLSLAARWPSDQPIANFAKFCDAFNWTDRSLALDMVERFLPTAIKALADDPVSAFRDLEDIAWHVLRMFDPLGMYVGRLAPTAREKSLGRRMCAELQPVTLAEKLSAAQKRDFQMASFLLSFLHKAAPRKYAATVAALDWDRIEATIGDDWSNLFHDAEVFFAVCYGNKASRANVAAVIERNLQRIVTLPPRLAFMAPAAAYKHVDDGRRIGLSGHGHFQWEQAAGVLVKFADQRPDLVEKLLMPSERDAGAVLSNKHPSWYQKATLFIRLLRQLAPASLDRTLASVDVSSAESGWAECLIAKGNARRTVALLVETAMARSDDVGEMARRLRARFPRASRPTPKDLERIGDGL